MTDERPEGWQEWEPPEDRGGSGAGAFEGKPPPGPGEHALKEAKKVDPSPSVGIGAPQPEFPPEGWGEPGENYPPTQGPLEERD